MNGWRPSEESGVQAQKVVTVVRAETPQTVGSYEPRLVSRTGAGDTVCLHGDVGAGKTCFARGFIRARTADPGLRVTSPSYLLDNSYEADDGLMCVRNNVRASRGRRTLSARSLVTSRAQHSPHGPLPVVGGG